MDYTVGTWVVFYWFSAIAPTIGFVGDRNNSDSLLSVFLLARHGERYPCHDIHHPAYPKEFVELRCRLTENGARQHFELGKFIRNRYSGFSLLKGLKKNDVHIRSTGTERTILSATYFGLGLNHNASTEFPVVAPVFSSPKRYDYLLKMSYPCPAFDKLFEKALASNISRQFAENERQLFEDLKTLFDFHFEPDSLHEYLPDLWKLCEPIYVWDNLERNTRGRFLPFSSDLASACHRALNFRQRLRFSTSDLTFFRGGPLWRHVVQTMKRYYFFGKGERHEAEDLDDLGIPVPSGYRLLAYFAHDSTLTAFMSHLRMFNNILPPYASAIIVELHRLADNGLALRFLYCNGTKLPLQLIPLTSEMCEDRGTGWCLLDVLEERLSGMAATNIEKACTSETAFPPIVSMAVSAFVASLAFACILPTGFTVRILLCLVSIFLTYRFLSLM